MTKTELYLALKAKGIFDTNTKDELWTKAFALHFQETRVKLSPSCGGCWPRLRRWLQS
jgi:hypothetical protein